MLGLGIDEGEAVEGLKRGKGKGKRGIAVGNCGGGLRIAVWGLRIGGCGLDKRYS